MHGTSTTSRAGSTPCARPSRALLLAAGRRLAGAPALLPPAAPAPAWLLTEAVGDRPAGPRPAPGGSGYGDAELAASSEEDEAERTRLIALVELARSGDAEAFGLLYDHYHGVGLPVPLLPHSLAAAGRGPHLGDLLPGAAQHELASAGRARTSAPG